jgi:uncharacterized protein YjbJ (UPF0337 family)
MKEAKRMAGKTDQMKGKAKEAVGDLTGNKDLKSEGIADRQAGEVKEKLGKVEERVEEGIDNVKDVLHKK